MTSRSGSRALGLRARLRRRQLLALVVLVLPLVVTELSVRAVRGFWSGHPISAGLVTGVVVALLVVVLIEEWLRAVEAKWYEPLSYEIEQALRQQLCEVWSRLEPGFPAGYASLDVAIAPTDDDAEDKAVRLSALPDWSETLAPVAHQLYEEMQALYFAAASSLFAREELLPLGQRFSTVQQRLRHLARSSEPGRVDDPERHLRQVLLATAMALRTTPIPKQAGSLRPWSPDVPGRGFLLRAGDTGETPSLVLWSDDGMGVTHREAELILGLTGQDILDRLIVDSGGVVRTASPNHMDAVLSLDRRLRRDPWRFGDKS